MITVDVKLIEVSRTKMQELGIDFVAFDGNQLLAMDGFTAVDQTPTTAIVGFVDALIKNEAACILANPKVAMLEGKEASLSIGSQVERTTSGNTHYVQLGTRLSVVSKLQTGADVQLDLLLEWSGHSPTVSEPEGKSDTRNFEIRTSIITPLGQSTLLTRSLETTKGREESVLLLVVTPELVETTANANGSGVD